MMFSVTAALYVLQAATARGLAASRTTANAMRYVARCAVCDTCGLPACPAQAKIPCSALCRCVGCRNLPDKPESKSLMQLADAAGKTLTSTPHPHPSPHPSPPPLTSTPHLHPSPPPLTSTPHLHPSPPPLTCTPHLHPSPPPLTCIPCRHADPATGCSYLTPPGDSGPPTSRA